MISMKKSSLYVFVICLTISLFIPKLFSGEFTVFKNDYIRDNGKPEIVVNSFSVFNSNTTWTLKVTNGSLNNNSADKISSAIITLNSVEIISQNQFNQNTNIIQLPVTIENENHLEVQLNGKPGAALSIEIIGIDDNSLTISNITPSNNDIIANNKPIISANFNDDISGINTNSFTLLLDNINITEQINVSENTFVFNPTSPLNDGLHTLLVTIEDNAGNQTQETADFTIDTTPPTIANITPEDGTTTENAKPIISFAYSDSLSGIDLNSVKIKLDGDDVTSNSIIAIDSAIFIAGADMSVGLHTAAFEVKDNVGHSSHVETTFIVPPTTQPPDLGMLGDQAVNVGNTLSFQVTATDPDSSDINLFIKPIPLPDNATFDYSTGLFSFTPDKTQEGISYSITFIASDGELTVSQAITITVNNIPLVGNTVLQGRILDANDAEQGVTTPIVGATVKNVETGVFTTTDSSGNFTLTGITGGINHIVYDGTNIAAGNNTFYGAFLGKKEIIGNITNVIKRPIYLMRIDKTGEVHVNPSETTTLYNSNLDITLTIPPNTVKDENGNDYNGLLSISEVPASFTPASLPEHLGPGLVVSLQPMGLTFIQPAPISFPNFDDLEPGSHVNLWSLDHTDGKFFIAGKGEVSNDGTVINTIEGGVVGTSWHSFVSPPIPNPPPTPIPTPTPILPEERTNTEFDPDRNENSENTDKSCSIEAKSGIKIQSGNFFEDYSLPSYNSLATQNRLKFVYNSLNAYPAPILTAQTSLPANNSTPIAISTDIRVSGLNFDNKIFKVGTKNLVRQSSMFDATAFETGSYLYFLVTQSHYTRSTVSSGISGNVIVNNQINSPFGAGWTLNGMQKLHGIDRPDKRILLTEGNGSSQIFSTKVVGTGAFSESTEEFNAENISDIITADFNNDNIADLASIDWGPFVTIYLGEGNGKFQSGLEFPAGNSNDIKIDDFNRDGILDIVTTNWDTDKFSIILGDGNGNFLPPTSFEVGIFPIGITVEDFNNDNLLDVAIVNYNSSDVSILYGDGEGDFIPGPNIDVFRPDLIFSGDFNNDNLIDVALGTDGFFVSIFLNNGDGSFAPPIDSIAGSVFVSIATADFNGDNILDVAVPNNRRDEVSILLGNGDGSFLPRTVYEVADYPRSIDTGDFNGDKIVDLAVVNLFGSAVSILVGDGLGNFSPPTEYPINGFPSSIAIADFNGNNVLDIAVRTNDKIIVIFGDTSKPGRSKGDFSTLVENSDGSFVRTMKDGTQINFDSNGFQTSTVDTNGNTTTYTYNQDGLLINITDPTNQITTFNYQDSLLSEVIDPIGRITTFQHDNRGNLINIIAPNGAESSYLYDSKHLMTAETDPNGNTHTINYSFAGRFESINFADGSTKQIIPSIQKGLVDLSAGIGDSVENSAPNLLVEDINSTIIDGNGNITTTKTDNFGAITESSDNCCLGRISKIVRNKDGLAISITKANGAVTTMTYDGNGNLLTSTDLSINATTTFTYDPNFNKVTSITDPNGNTTTINYDTKGNPMEIIDALGNSTTGTYNVNGQITSIVDALGNTTVFAYDTNGNILTVTDPLGNVTNLTADAVGNIVTATDANGNAIQLSYDTLNRLTEVIDANNNITFYNYDANGNLTEVMDANNNVTQFEYDSMDRVIINTDSLGNSDAFTYDRNENLLSVTNRNGQTINFEYDTLNKLIKKSLPDNIETHYTYDIVGNLTSIAAPGSDLNFTYDNGDREIAVSTLGSSNQPDVRINYTYDANDNRITMLNSLTGTTNYTYDALNRISTITNPSNQQVDFTYDVLSRRISKMLPNGVTTNYSYDHNNKLKELQHNLGLTSLSAFTYIYDNVGNRTNMDTVRSNLTVNNSLNYQYDNIYQLAQAANPLPAMPDETFNYDPLGNRLNRDGQTIDSIIGTNNQLLEDAKFVYTYDNNGNLVKKNDKLSTEITSYIYNVENQLVQINMSGGSIAKYTYDGLGRRVVKDVNGSIVRYIYDKEDIILEFDGNNNQIAQYTHGSGIDEPLIMERDNQYFYYHVDGLGSIVDMTDISGTVVQSYVYDSFGNIKEQVGTLLNPYTYTGREFDIESGLYYYRARYYDSGIGRFLNEDPIGLNGGINFYIYVLNNSINLVDPSGYITDLPERLIGGGVVSLGAFITASGNYYIGIPLIIAGVYILIETPFSNNTNQKLIDKFKKFIEDRIKKIEEALKEIENK